jgi:hypothetical protein
MDHDLMEKINNTQNVVTVNAAETLLARIASSPGCPKKCSWGVRKSLLDENNTIRLTAARTRVGTK